MVATDPDCPREGIFGNNTIFQMLRLMFGGVNINENVINLPLK